MNKTEVINKVSRTFYKAKLGLIKHSPEILVFAGITGTITSAVLACRATTKLSGILEDTKDDIEKIHECAADEKYADEYTKEDSKKDITIVYIQTGVKLAKLYAPSVSLGVLSITSILCGHNILRKRNIALAAAYTAVDKSLKDYRSRVIERFGETVDRELRYNIKAKTITETEIDENGNEKTVEKTVDVIDLPNVSEYAKFFDEYSEEWEKDADYNLTFLRLQQQYANDLLKAKGYLFLNDVYGLLGFPKTKAGQVVGWIYEPNNSSRSNYVDFGIYDGNREVKRAFVNGYERSILLDFNVDGDILNNFEAKERERR